MTKTPLQILCAISLMAIFVFLFFLLPEGGKKIAGGCAIGWCISSVATSIVDLLS